jgi:hypothetical protein
MLSSLSSTIITVFGICHGARRAPSPVRIGHASADLLRKRKQGVWPLRGGCEGTGASYLFRRAAVYVDKIIKGANAADLPVQQPPPPSVA